VNLLEARPCLSFESNPVAGPVTGVERTTTIGRTSRQNPGVEQRPFPFLFECITKRGGIASRGVKSTADTVALGARISAMGEEHTTAIVQR
jgi:hypothetical protein